MRRRLVIVSLLCATAAAQDAVAAARVTVDGRACAFPFPYRPSGENSSPPDATSCVAFTPGAPPGAVAVMAAGVAAAGGEWCRDADDHWGICEPVGWEPYSTKAGLHSTTVPRLGYGTCTGNVPRGDR